MNNRELLEDTGYSFSGIANYIDGDKDNARKLLIALDDEFNVANARVAEIEEQLSKAKMYKSLIAGSFQHVHSAIKATTPELVFDNKGVTVVVKTIQDKDELHYARYPHTL